MAASALISWAAVLVAAAGFSQAAAHPRHILRHTSPPPSLDVRPAPEIDARVAYEVARAGQILEDLNQDNLLASPYLVSAIYYHDGFLKGFPVDRRSADPERRIVGQICDMLTPERKAHFVNLLHHIWLQSDVPGPPRMQDPLTYSSFGGAGASHPDAIDLFAPEGSPVQSVSRGIVVMADGNWIRSDPFSASSRKGGNEVIVFDPDHDRFYRYCHLSTVLVSSGELVSAGRVIGAVGHTGWNASLPGHGHHLHFESNEYVDGRVLFIGQQQLRAMLLSWHASATSEDGEAAQDSSCDSYTDVETEPQP